MLGSVSDNFMPPYSAAEQRQRLRHEASMILIRRETAGCERERVHQDWFNLSLRKLVHLLNTFHKFLRRSPRLCNNCVLKKQQAQEWPHAGHEVSRTGFSSRAASPPRVHSHISADEQCRRHRPTGDIAARVILLLIQSRITRVRGGSGVRPLMVGDNCLNVLKR